MVPQALLPRRMAQIGDSKFVNAKAPTGHGNRIVPDLAFFYNMTL